MKVLPSGASLMLFLLVAGLFWSSGLFAQPVSEIPLAKDYKGIIWKSNADLTMVMAAEHNQNTILLTTPGLPDMDRAVYTAYDRLLQLILADLSNGNPLEEIAVSDFQRVVDEAPNDPIMKLLHVGTLRHYFNQLIEKMAEPQKPKIEQN